MLQKSMVLRCQFNSDSITLEHKTPTPMSFMGVQPVQRDTKLGLPGGVTGSLMEGLIYYSSLCPQDLAQYLPEGIDQ